MNQIQQILARLQGQKQMVGQSRSLATPAPAFNPSYQPQPMQHAAPMSQWEGTQPVMNQWNQGVPVQGQQLPQDSMPQRVQPMPQTAPHLGYYSEPGIQSVGGTMGGQGLGGTVGLDNGQPFINANMGGRSVMDIAPYNDGSIHAYEGQVGPFSGAIGIDGGKYYGTASINNNQVGTFGPSGTSNSNKSLLDIILGR